MGWLGIAVFLFIFQGVFRGLSGETGSHYETFVQQVLYNHAIENGKTAYYLAETLSMGIRQEMNRGNLRKKVNIKTATAENFDTVLRTGDILVKEVIMSHIVVSNPDPFVTMLWRQYIER